jgi:hypothetical protein
MLKPKTIYLVLAILGTVLPCAKFIPWLLKNGLNLPLLADQIASSPVASFGWLNVFFATIALFVFMVSDGRNRKVRLVWLTVFGTLMAGVSLGLPLYLFLREISRPGN